MVNESALALLTKRTSEITEKNEARQKSFEDSKKSLEAEKRCRDGIGDGRWQNRRAFGSPKTRKCPNWIGASARAKENLAKRQAKARPRKYRLRRSRPCAVKSAGKAHGGPHKRLTSVELRRGLAQGQFQSWMADQVKDALKEGSTRAVIICRCGSLTTFTQADKAEETWAEHVKKTAKPKIERSLKMHLPLFGKDKRDRRAILKRARRMQRQANSSGLLAQLRCSMSGQIPALQMASRYLVSGGSGTWNATDTNNWAATDGGASGVSVPTSADDVFFTATSGAGTILLATDGSTVCRSWNTTGFTGTISWRNSSGTSVSIGDGSGGALTFSATTIITGLTNNTDAIKFVSTSTNGGAGWSVTTNGLSCPTMTFQGAGGKWVLSGSLTINSSGTGAITLTAGTVDTANQSLSAWAFSSNNSNVRTFTMGSSAIALSSTGNSWAQNVITNLTYTANTAIITFSGTTTTPGGGGTMNFNGSSMVFSGSGIPVWQFGGSTVANLTRTGTAVKTDGFSFLSNPIVTGTFTVNSNSSINRVLVQSTTLGTARTITAAVVVITNVGTFQDITGAGAATWTVAGTGATFLGDAGGNSGITFTTSASQTWSGTSGGNWSTNAWTSRVPLPQDDVVINAAFIASQTVTADMPRLGRSIDWTGATGSPTFTTSTAISSFGSLTLIAGITFTQANGWTFSARSSYTITSAGKTFATSITVSAVGGTYTIQDAFVNSGGITSVTNGTFTANNQTIACDNFNASGSALRTVSMGTGAWSLTRVSTTPTTLWNTAIITNLTLTVSTAIVSCTGAPASGTVNTITTGGVTMPSFTVNGGANLTVQFSDAFTTAGTITITAAKLDTNGVTVNAGVLNLGNASTRTLTLGSSPITLTGSGLQSTASTNLTMTANTATITVTSGGGTVVALSGTGISFNGTTIVIQPISSAPTLNFGGYTVTNLTFTGWAAKTAQINMSGPVTVATAFVANGNSTTNRLLVDSSALGTARTITANGTITTSNSDWQDIIAAGTASWNISAATGGSGDALGNTGITFTTAAPQFWFSGTGNWSDNTKWFLATAGGGGAGRVPLPQDNATFDSSSFTAGSQTITTDMPRMGNNIIMTSVTNSPLFSDSGNAPTAYGNWSFGTLGGTPFSSNVVTLSGRGSQTITCNAMSFVGGLNIKAVGGTYTFQDALTVGVAATLTATAGTMAANNFAVIAGKFDSSSTALTRVVTMGSGAWSLNIVSSTSVWNTASTNLTLTISTAIVSCTGAPGSAATVTVTTGSVSMPSFTVNGGANLTVQFSDAFIAGSTATLTVTAAKLDTNNQTVSLAASLTSNNSNTRTIALGSSSISLTGNNTVVDFTISSNLTFTAGTSTITASGINSLINGGAKTFNAVVFIGTGNPRINQINTFGNLTRTGTAVKTDGFIFGTNQTITGTFTVTGNSTVNRILVSSVTLGTTVTITCNGTCTHTNVDWQDITGAGTGAPFTGTSMGDALGNTNITFDAPVTRYGVVAGNWSSTATWSNTSGGAGGFSVPLPQDTVILNASSAAGTYTADMPRLGLDLTMTGFTRTWQFTGIATCSIYGNLTLASGMTTPTSNAISFAGRGSQTITSAGKSLGCQIVFAAFGGTYTQQDAISSSRTDVSAFSVTNGTWVCNNQTVTGPSFSTSGSATKAITMGTGTWTLNGNGIAVFNVGGTGGGGTTLTVTGSSISFTGTSGTSIIFTTSQTMPPLTFNGAGGTWQFQDAVTISAGNTITLTSGTLDTNNKTISAGAIALTGSTIRTITLGSSAISLSSNGTAWSAATVTNLTVTSNTSIVTCTGSTTISTGAINWNGLTLIGTGLTMSITGTDGPTFGNLTRTGNTNKTDSISFGINLTIAGTASFNGNSITNRLLVQSNTLGIPRTITVNGTRTHTNLDLMDMAGSGVGLDLSAITGGSGDCGGNSGYTFTPAQTNYWVGGTGNTDTLSHWASSSNGAGSSGRVPLSQDTARFDANTGVGTVTFNMPRVGTVNCTGSNASSIASSLSFTIFGDLVMPVSGTITSWGSTQTFGGRGNQTITSNGRSVSWNPFFSGPSGTYTVQDAFSGSTMTVSYGTFNANNQAITMPSVQSTSNQIRTLTMGSGTWSLTITTTSTAWSVSATNLTFNVNTSTITISAASANTRTFAGGGQTYNNVSYIVTASTGVLAITGANTFTNLTVTSEAGNAKTLTMPSATTNTITGTLSLNGVTSAHMILNSSTPGSQATISAGTGATINVNFVDIQDSNAIGGARFFDHDGNSTSNNTGWLFVTAIGDTVTLNWQNTIAISKTVAYRWNVRSRVGKQDSLLWNVRHTLGDQVQALWNVRHIIGDQVTLNWQATIAVTAPLSLLWNVRHILGDELQTIWNDRSLIGKQRSLLWNDRHIIGDQVTFNWQTRLLTPKDLDLEWSLRHILNNQIQIAWNTTTFIGKPIILKWQDRHIVGDQVGFLWHLVFALGVPIELVWEVSRFMSNPSSSTTLERFDFSEVSLED